MRVKQDELFEDADFDSPTSMLIWANGRIAKHAENWRLSGVTTAEHPRTKQPYWMGLTFKPKPVIEKAPLVS